MNQETPDNYSTKLYELVFEMIVNYNRNHQQAASNLTETVLFLEKKLTKMFEIELNFYSESSITKFFYSIRLFTISRFAILTRR
jgi:hypothetical protein